MQIHGYDLFEAKFPYSEEQFRQWAIGLGWSPQVIDRSRGNAELTRYEDLETVMLPDAIYLTTLTNRSNESDIHDALRLVWDAQSSEAYIQVCPHEYRDAVWREYRGGWGGGNAGRQRRKVASAAKQR